MSETAITTNVLAMVIEVLRDHDASRDGGLTVVPCLTDDLPACLDIIAAAVRQAGGVVVNTSAYRQSTESVVDAEDFHASVAGTPPRAWTETLQAALQVIRPAGTYEVVIDNDAGRVDARYRALAGVDPDDAPPANHDTVLAVARALCSSRLLEHRLGVLVYDDTILDASQQRPLWNLSEHLIEHPTANLRTLIVLARATADLSRHSQPRTGFRWALRGSELLRRNNLTSMTAHVNTILASAAPFTALFLGAGFSASSGLALGNALRDRAIKDLGVAPHGAGSLELALAFYQWASPGRLLPSEEHIDRGVLASRLTLERVLREHYREFNGEHPPTLVNFQTECTEALTKMGGAPRALHRLMASGRRLVICTVNFDELVEHTPVKTAVFGSDADFLDAPGQLRDYLSQADDRIPVWKLHGTITDLSTCVANDAVTLLGLSQPKEDALLTLLAESLTPIPWIYVGASMRDTDLTPLLGRREFAEKLREYWVLPHTITSVEDFVYNYRVERWNKWSRNGYGKRLITETADTFLKAFADRAERLSSP